MSNQHTPSDNELIAEFCGMKLVVERNHGHDDFEWLPRFEHSNWCFETPPPFHKSWDWLMPVVEKIESIGYITSITTGSCVICPGSDLEKREDISLFSWHSGVNYNSKLKNTYEAVVEFIKWHNAKSKVL